MESKVSSVGLKKCLIFFLCSFLSIGLTAASNSQEGPISGQSGEKAEIRLRKTIKTRQYRGKFVEGEERAIVSGDTLWRFLIQERGLPKKKFGRYLILLGSLNPKLKNPDILRIGDLIFIPIRPDEILEIEIPSGKGGGKVYRVKRGDFLFKILKEQRGLQKKDEIRNAFNQVKRLNPRKEDWNFLFVGEAILLPPLIEGGPPEVIIKPAKEFIGLDYGLKLRVEENLNLLREVVGVVGNEMTREGEEELALKEGTIHLDRSIFPVIRNSQSGKKVVLNLEDMIAPSILTQIQSQNHGISIVTGKKGGSLHEAVNSLFSQLGFQALPTDRPVVLHDKGVGLQVKGEWMIANPDEGGRKQEMWIISLTNGPGTTPDYLREYLALKGMNLKEILLPSSPFAPVASVLRRERRETGSQIQTWPSDKKSMVDALLTTYQIPFSSQRQISLSLRKGVRLVTVMDRFFERRGRKFGIFFRPVGDEIKKALKKGEDITPIVLNLASLSSREILSLILTGIGERAPYKEHRFPVVEEGPRDKLVLTVSGFFLPDRSLLLTDRTIPGDFQRFFFEKGLRVIYFQ